MQSALGFIPFAEPLRALEVVGLKFGLQEQLGKIIMDSMATRLVLRGKLAKMIMGSMATRVVLQEQLGKIIMDYVVTRLVLRGKLPSSDVACWQLCWYCVTS